MLVLAAYAMTASPNCTALTSCGACAANDACGWCTAGAVCMERRREASCHGCLRTSADACGPAAGCASRTDCAACGASSACVWYTQSQRCLDALVDPRSGSVAACHPERYDELLCNKVKRLEAAIHASTANRPLPATEIFQSGAHATVRPVVVSALPLICIHPRNAWQRARTSACVPRFRSGARLDGCST